MGCDIHAHAEVRKDGKWTKVGEVFPLSDWDQKFTKGTHTDEPFTGREYGKFAFLAGVRNYNAIMPLAEPKYAIPDDVSEEVRKDFDSWGSDGHSHTWLTLGQLADFDYEAMMEDRRCMRNNNGGSTCEPGEGVKMTYREFLGTHFFADLGVLKSLGAPDDVRVVFWFDN